MRAKAQRYLPFETSKEQDRLERIERILSGKLGSKVRPASELQFDYTKASRQHRECVLSHERLDSQEIAPVALGGG